MEKKTIKKAINEDDNFFKNVCKGKYISRYKLTIELFIALNNNNGICRANKYL